MDRRDFLRNTADAVDRDEGHPATEKVVVADESHVLEYRGGEWHGPIEHDDDYFENANLEHVGKVTQDQLERLK